MKIACLVLSVIAVILGIVIIIVLLQDKKKKAVKQSGSEKPSNVEGTTIKLTSDSEVSDRSTASSASPQDIPEYALDKDNTSVVDNTVEDEAGSLFGAGDTQDMADNDETEEQTNEGEKSSADIDGDENEEFAELKAVVENGETRYIIIKYSKSFQAKLIQSSDETKRYYSQLKNTLLSYGVKSRMSWKWESFRYGRKTLAKFRLRGKTLSLVLALDPNDYENTKYHVESIADIACYADTPCMYRLKNERRIKYSADLIAKLMQDNGLTANPPTASIDYAKKYPYETTEALVERKLIKVLTDEAAQSGEMFKPSDLRTSVSAQEVDKILQDEIVSELIEKGEGITDKTKTGIINIDTLSQYFADGETITLEEIKKRINGFGKTTYIKVLARGTLDKRLIVEADDFSLQAVKMIVLIGGKAIKR